jgi:hypothetical protein
MTTSKRVLWLAILLPAVLLSGCGEGVERPDLPFARDLGEPADFAALESSLPLTDEHRQALTPENLATFDQDELDQIYARLEGGPVPDGPYMGTIIFAEGGGPRKLAERIGRIAEGVVDLKLAKLDFLGEALWKGKVFYRDAKLLRNQIDHEDVVRRLFDVPAGAMIKEQIGGREVALLFPAALYCGDSLLDPRRDSVIIDYADTDRLPGFIPEVDYLAGRDKLRVRDEIRMIRPGFYLGRAYLRETFALTFTLLNEEVEAAGVAVGEPCWDGRGPRPVPPQMESGEPTGETSADAAEPV